MKHFTFLVVATAEETEWKHDPVGIILKLIPMSAYLKPAQSCRGCAMAEDFE